MIRTYGLLFGAALLALAPAHDSLADITIFFTPTPSGGVSVVGSGSGFTNRDPGVASSDWDIQDFLTNILVSPPTLNDITADTTAGTFTNVTTGVSETIFNFRVDADSGGEDDIDFQTTQALAFSFGDEFLLSFTATFEPATLMFSQLVPGVHIEPARSLVGNNPIAEEQFGPTTAYVVPEPAAALMMLVGLGLAAGLVRRRSAA